MEIDNWPKKENKLDELLFQKLLNKLKTNVKNLSNDILEMPKWWYPIIIVSGWVWFVLWCTVLIWIPWTTIIFIYGWLKIVLHLDKQVAKIVKITKERIKDI